MQIQFNITLKVELQYSQTTLIIMSLSSPLTVIGMINGMIGGFILILPVNALHAGWVFTLLVIVIVGAFSYYSCYICVVHLGDQKDLDHAMYVHFNKNIVIKIIYDLTVFANLLFLGFLYFQLICIQWEGITQSQSIANPISNTFALFILIFVLKYFQFGASIMAYGIISIIGYVIFLIWVVATAPSGENTWKPFGTGQINLAAAMGGAYSIQTFFIPVLKKNPNPHKYSFFTLLAYIAGSLIYFYIAFAGSFGILNRVSVVGDPSTIQNFFLPGQVQVTIIQVLYLIHLYSVFPQFTLISKKRLFSIFRLKQTQKGKIPIPQIIYAIIFCGVCLVIRLVKVNINQIVDINGSVIGFFFIYFLPAILHIKCLYFSKNTKISFADKLDMKIKSQQYKQNQQIDQTERQQIQGKNNYQSQTNANNYKRTTKIQMSDYRKSNDLAPLQVSSKNIQQQPNIIKQPLIQVHLAEQSHQLKQINKSQFESAKQEASNFNRLDSKHQSAQQTVKPFRYTQYQSELKKADQSIFTVAFQQQKQQQLGNHFVCDCKKPKSIVLQVIQLVVLVIMIALGVFILVNGIMTV